MNCISFPHTGPAAMLVNSHICRTREVTVRVRVSTGINGAVQVIETNNQIGE